MAGWLSILEAIAPYVETAGTVAAGVAGNRAAGRQAENAATASGDANALNAYQLEQIAKLGGARLGEEATQDRADRYLGAGRERAGQAAFGDILSNLRDVNIDLPAGIPRFTISGGLRPSALGENARAAGATLSRDALAAMMSGADVPNLPDLRGIGTNAPTPTPMAEANGLDRLLELTGYAGLAANTARTVQDRRRTERERRDAANRTPLPPVNTGQYIPPITPEIGGQYTPPTAASDYRVNTLELLAQMKREEEAARLRGNN